MELPGKTRKKLTDALISAFPQRSLLEQFLDFELDKKLNRITHNDNLQTEVYQLINIAEAEGWLIDLVIVASKEKSGNVLLKEIAREILSTSELELDLYQLLYCCESRELHQKIQKGDLESDIPQDYIQQAYRDTLPRDANLWGSKVNSTREILKKVVEFRIQFEFVSKLSKNEYLSEDIRNRLSECAKKLASKKHLEENKNKPSIDFSDREKKLESYLLATIEHYDNKKYLLKAWLIIDDSVLVNDPRRFTQLLDEDEKQLGVICEFDDLPKQVDKFLSKSLEYLRNKRFKLIIEIFLPRDLINTEVDCWKISDAVLEDV